MSNWRLCTWWISYRGFFPLPEEWLYVVLKIHATRKIRRQYPNFGLWHNGITPFISEDCHLHNTKISSDGFAAYPRKLLTMCGTLMAVASTLKGPFSEVSLKLSKKKLRSDKDRRFRRPLLKLQKAIPMFKAEHIQHVWMQLIKCERAHQLGLRGSQNQPLAVDHRLWPQKGKHSLNSLATQVRHWKVIAVGDNQTMSRQTHVKTQMQDMFTLRSSHKLPSTRKCLPSAITKISVGANSKRQRQPRND